MRKPISYTALLLGLVICMAPAISIAQNSPPANGVAAASGQAQQTPAGKFIQDLGSKAISIITDKSLTQAQRSEKYSDLLHDAFDIPAIGHFVLGRAWNTASPEQQQEFLKLFESLVIKTYGDRLNFYSGEGFQVKGVRTEDDKDTVVSSVITHPQAETPTPVDWRVHTNNGKLAIVDVSVEGVSQNVTQRDEYTAIIQRNNGNIDGLLSLMRQRLGQSSTDAPRN